MYESVDNLGFFQSKTLLITGGSGSFGNACLKRFLNTEIAEIRILSRDEKKQDDMRKMYQNEKIKFYIGDVRNLHSCREAIEGVDFIFHAAALKQVPSCEFFPMEAVKTNIIGTDNVLSEAIRAGVKSAVCLSTDKAAYPINAMGMSKALEEKAAVARSRSDAETKISVTRYGNVMYSRGSVIPLFVDAALRGEPLTITDPAMTRFMMNLDEAIDLVLFAFENARGGDLFIQKSPAATLETIAQAVIQLFNSKSEIRNIGIRHGEKMDETLMTFEESFRAEDMGHYYRISPDSRDLNYGLYENRGRKSENASVPHESYTSANTQRLDVAGTIAKLKTVSEIRELLQLDS
jgi:UDP-glucose 4-epimerase